MTGKNKSEKSFRIWLDDSDGTPRDLSGDLVPGSASGGGKVFDEVDMTGVSESVRNYLSGHAESEISASFHLNDTASTGAHTVIAGNIGGAGTITLQWGSAGAAPTNPDPEWEGEYIYQVGDVAVDGNKLVIGFTAKPTGSSAPSWGTVAA